MHHVLSDGKCVNLPLSFICLLGMNFLFALVLIFSCKHKMGNEGFVEKH